MKTRRFINLFVLALVAATMLVACGGTKKNEVPADAIAIVGNEPVTKSDFNSLLAQVKAQYVTAKKTFPAVGSKSYQTLQDSMVAYLVKNAAITQQATKMGVKITDAAVESNLTQVIKKQFGGSQAKYLAYIKKEHLTEAQVKERIRENLINNKVYTALIQDIKVSQSDIEDYYNAHKSSYSIGESRAVSHILVKTKAQAEKIYQQLKAGANFAKLAKKYSTDTGSKTSGGSLGSMEKKKLVKPFADVLFSSSLKTGSFSKPVQTTYGWHIIEATGPITKARVKKLSEVSATIKSTLLSTKQSAATTSWVKKAEKYAADNTNYASGYAPTTTTTTNSSTVATSTT